VSAGGLLGLDALIRGRWKWGEKQLDRIPQDWRRRIEVAVFIGAVFYAGYSAWSDEYFALQKANTDKAVVRGERDEARRQRDANISPTVNRLSGDLEAARGQIDQQKGKIAKDEAEIEQLETPPTPRNMAIEQFKRIVTVFTLVSGQFPNVTVEAVSASDDAAGYAQIFMTAFHAAGMTVNGIKPDDNKQMLYPDTATVSSPTMRGLYIGVENRDSPPAPALQFQALLKSAGFDTNFASWHGAAGNSYVFVVSYR